MFRYITVDLEAGQRQECLDTSMGQQDEDYNICLVFNSSRCFRLLYYVFRDMHISSKWTRTETFATVRCRRPGYWYCSTADTVVLPDLCCTSSLRYFQRCIFLSIKQPCNCGATLSITTFYPRFEKTKQSKQGRNWEPLLVNTKNRHTIKVSNLHILPASEFLPS